MTETAQPPDTASQEDHEKFMREAIALARETSIVKRAGGAFGCVIVKDGKVVGRGSNHVLAHKDPTAHGEVEAIRDACRNLGTHVLAGCDLYTSCACCPMCYAASFWARVDRIYYAATVADTRTYGDFDDDELYRQMALSHEEQHPPQIQILRDEMVEVWKEFHDMPDRPHY
jgi:tRNA(Arg) A34 adenosine deaminase TadA